MCRWLAIGPQVKFSELTLDMFRMLQAFEREPEENFPRTLSTSAQAEDLAQDMVIKIVINVAIYNGSRTEWSPIRSVIIRVITKLDDREAGVQFF